MSSAVNRPSEHVTLYRALSHKGTERLLNLRDPCVESNYMVFLRVPDKVPVGSAGTWAHLSFRVSRAHA